MTIPGVTYHPRSSWEDPAFPVSRWGQTPTVDPAAIDTAVIHYTGADDLIDGDPGESADDLPQYLRNIQHHYMTSPSRGYAIGYRWAVDWLGGVWQLRGWEYKSAANRGHNHHTEPILLLVDGNDMATPYAVRSVRAIIAESQRRSGRPFKIVGHGDIGSTSCPGVGLRAQLRAGAFTPHPTDPPPPPIVPELPGDPDMWPDAYRIVTFTEEPYGAFLVGPGGVVHLDAHLRDVYVAAGVKAHKSDNADLHASYTRIARGL